MQNYTSSNNDLFFTLTKRAIDIFGSILFIIVFSPIYIGFGLAIWLQDFHSPIYTHTRIGQNRKPFTIYKFRSMVVNADAIMMQNKEIYNQLRSENNKIKEDPRVTKLGKFIRKYSIDEFPQAFNVLFGTMSWVGPRPLRPDELEIYRAKDEKTAKQFDVILTMKPGITGLWQVSGRSNISFDERLNLEETYAKSKSLALDLKIMVKTPLVALKGEGAY